MSIADDVSGGISVQDLSKRWKSGRYFLTCSEERWPRSFSTKAQNSSYCQRDHDSRSYRLPQFLKLEEDCESNDLDTTARTQSKPKQLLGPYIPPFYYTAITSGTLKWNSDETRPRRITEYYLRKCFKHFQLANNYSTVSYFQALRRFFSIWGYPNRMLGKNGTQLVGAARDLREMVECWDVGKLRTILCRKRSYIAIHYSTKPKWMCRGVSKKYELYTCLFEAANLV